MGVDMNLLGFQNPYSDETTQLLGLNPSEMRRQAIFQGLMQAGAGLATTGNVGGAMLGLARGINDGREQYMDQALLGYRAKTNAEEAAWRQQQRQEEAAARQAEEEAQNAAIAGLPPEMRSLAKAFPSAVIPQYVRNTYFPEQAGANVNSYAPIPYDMGDGQVGYGIPKSDGTFTPVQGPDGAKFLSPYDKAYQQGAGSTAGKTITEQRLTAPADLQAADMALGILDQIVSHPYLERGTGFSSYGNVVRGTGGYDFQNLVEQAKSGAFLTAIEQMKGLGALSNMEGQAATAAVTRMDSATSKEAFLKAVADYRGIIETAKDRAMSRGAEGQQPVPQPIQGGPSIDDLVKQYGG
jgi:hypothetical protein